jgi:hypothetical protein
MKKISLLSIFIAFAILIACEKNSNENANHSDSFSDFPPKNLQDEMIILGNQLQNPYSVENMQLAYNTLKQRYGTRIPNINISATHYYIKFSPKNEEEYLELIADTSLELCCHPLDYEILNTGGLYYQDPSIPDSLPTFQYASVKTGYTPITHVAYTVLENLCIPEITDYYLQILNDTVLNLLIDEALILTDNYDNDTSLTKSTLDYDIKKYFIPVENVIVNARRWFTVYTDRTDDSGYFYMHNTFKRPCNYSLIWTTWKYYISNDVWFPAIYDGPKKTGTWNLEIDDSGKSFRFATIFRAGHRYFEENIGGLKRPGVWTILKIAYIDDAGTGITWGDHWQNFIFGWAGLPNITIWGKVDENNYYKSNVLFSTTIHELGHASHISLLNDFQFIQVDEIIRESWANCVEWYITKIEYNELGVTDYDDPSKFISGDHMQWWHKPLDYSHNENIYTPIFIDLVDEYNQALLRGNLPTNRCPDGGTFNGYNCFVIQPPYLEHVYVENYTFYYTPQNCCGCPIAGTYYNGQTCFVMVVPETSIPFISGNSGFIYPAGNIDYPYDQVTGYTMNVIESDILKHSYGLSSLEDYLKLNMPVEMTERHINVFMTFFFNL